MHDAAEQRVCLTTAAAAAAAGLSFITTAKPTVGAVSLRVYFTQ